MNRRLEILETLEKHDSNDNSVCKLCGPGLYHQRDGPLPPTSHGHNLAKYNKQGINYHVITPNCLLWHNSNQNGPPSSCFDDENDYADDDKDIEDNDDYEEVEDGGGTDLQMF